MAADPPDLQSQCISIWRAGIEIQNFTYLLPIGPTWIYLDLLSVLILLFSQGGYVFDCVSLFVGLSGGLHKKLLHGFLQN